MKKNQMNRRGLSIIEVVGVVLVLSMIGMTMGPVMQKLQTEMRQASSTSNLHRIGIGGALYANSNKGRIFGFSWKANVPYLMPDGRVRTSSSEVTAAMYQETEILMRRTGRLSGQFRIVSSFNALVHKRMSHLVLEDYLNRRPENTLFIDSADSNQFFWRANPLEYVEWESTLPYAGGDIPQGYDTNPSDTTPSVMMRWTFGSSYQIVPSAWQQDYPYSRYTPVQSTTHLFTRSNGKSGPPLSSGRNFAEVSFPGQKVWMFEEFDREQIGNPYFAYDRAMPEKLMFDGSVNSQESGDAQSAVIPEYDPVAAWEQTYVPFHRFPIPMAGLGDNTPLNQRYRWTKDGLSGWDY